MRKKCRRGLRALPIACALISLCFAFLAGQAAGEETIDVSQPLIVHAREASDMEVLAARELLRYLYRVSGKIGSIAADDAIPPDSRKTIVLIDAGGNNRLAASVEERESLSADAKSLGDEGFRLKATTWQENPAILIAAAKPVGVLRGVYALLEKLGFGFYLGGDTFPPAGTPMVLPESLDEVHKPVFEVRGSLPWYNFLNSPTPWDLEDHKYFYDQMSKQGFNFVGYHSYDHEPFCAYEWEGDLIGGEPLKSSLNYDWGMIRGLQTAEFGFGGGEYFDRDPFSSRSLLDGKDREDQIRRSQRMLAEALNYARRRGIRVCVGFELVGDPTNAGVQARLESRIAALLRNYPMLDYVWFWQSEGRGGGAEMPARGSALEIIARKSWDTFAYLEQPGRICEAARVAYFANTAYRIVRKYRRDLPVIISGWGGDRWMRFSDFYLGLDKVLPGDVIFAALDNIDPAWEPNVSNVYGRLSPERERWPIPWWESDGGGARRDQWAPQCNVKPFTALCRDVLEKKCQGMLGIHWRTRDVEEVAAYQARFAWNPDLSYESFFDDFATKCFGRKWAKAMSGILQELESLGPHWTGSLGQVECGRFSWFSDNRLPTKENMQKLSEIRLKVDAIREEMIAEKRSEGLERIEWLLTTIDWVTRYDRAALELHPGGSVEKLLREAETAKGKGDVPLAQEKARAAWAAMEGSGFKEAIQTFPLKMSTMGEFGSYATIQVKAYASYLGLCDRVEGILGELPGELGGPPVSENTPPFVVGRQSPTTLEAGRPFEVSAIALAGKPIRGCAIHYRKLGEKEWTGILMKKSFRSTFTGTLPAMDSDTVGVEWFVGAKDQAVVCATWPKGFPAILWSASVIPPVEPAARPAAPVPAAPGAPLPFTAAVTGNYEVTLAWDEVASSPGLVYEVHRGDNPAFEPGNETLIATCRFSPAYDTIAAAGRNCYALLPLADGKRGAISRTSVVVPQPSPPKAPSGVEALPGPGKVRLTWQPAKDPDVRFTVYRAEQGSDDFRCLNPDSPWEEVFFIDRRPEVGKTYRYSVRSVDRGGQQGPASPIVEAAALPIIQEPVFVAKFDGDTTGTLLGGNSLEGEIHPPARFGTGVAGEALDVTEGGYVRFPHRPEFEIAGDISVEFWMKLSTQDPMPVVLACGEWEKNGWFLQVFNGGFRWYIGRGQVCDGGRPPTNRFIHVVATYDGESQHVYQDGRKVASRRCSQVDFTPWKGPLYVGQYHFLTMDYQVRGVIDEVRIYQRALSEAEALAHFEAGSVNR